MVYSEEAAELHAQPICIFLSLNCLIFLTDTSIIHCLSLVLQKVLKGPCVNLCGNMNEKDVSVMASLQFNIKLDSANTSKSNLGKV